jgi:hypothetical protein
MFVFDVEKNGGLGYGSLQFERILQVSHKYNAVSIHGTISEEVPLTMAFLKKERICCQREVPYCIKKISMNTCFNTIEMIRNKFLQLNGK